MSVSTTSARHTYDTHADRARRTLARAKSTCLAVISSFHPDAEHAWLVDAQVRLYRRSTRNNPLALIVGAFLISQMCAAWVPFSARTTWWIGVAIVSLGIDITARYLDRTDDTSLEAVRLRARCTVGLAALFAFAWGAMGVFLWAPGSEVDHMAVVLILACTIAGSTAVSIHPATAAASLLIFGAFLVGPLALSGTRLDTTLAWLSTLYVVLMAGQLAATAANSRRMLTLEHEREALVASLHQAKAESDRDRERAAAAGRTKSQFLSNMNHELRTPMNAILGFSELIKHKSFGDAVDKYAEYAEIIHSSGQHLLALIDGMLDLARIEGGRLTLRENSVDLKSVLVEAVEGVEQIAEERELSLTTRIGRAIPHIIADERAMRHIVENLLSNALKFTPPKGCITVFAHVEPDGRIAFGVADTGIGIAEEDQETVFERFGKGRHDVTTMDKGTGLGLAIVKGFAEAHDGEVALESAPGTGTRITVFIPSTRIERPAHEDRAAG